MGPCARAAIYARYNPDMRRLASIEDQVDDCRPYARATDLEYAKSCGSCLVGRMGRGARLANAECDHTQAVLVKSIDRLACELANKHLGVRTRARRDLRPLQYRHAERSLD